MAKLASLDAAARLLDQVSPSEVEVEIVDRATRRIRLTGPPRQDGHRGSIVLTGHEILLTLFPPRSDRKVIEVVEQELGVLLPELPLDPFLWGLDSI